jgi:rubrerythrin
VNIFEFSIQMEKDAETLYKSLAAKTSHVGIKKVFNMLAEDETRHAKAIEILEKKMQPEEETISSVGEVTTVFKKIKEDKDTKALSEDILPELRRALEIEKKGMEFYKEQIGSLESEEARKLFKLLSHQENYHYNTVENLIELVEKPLWWVEHAEFTPKGDDYY